MPLVSLTDALTQNPGCEIAIYGRGSNHGESVGTQAEKLKRRTAEFAAEIESIYPGRVRTDLVVCGVEQAYADAWRPVLDAFGDEASKHNNLVGLTWTPNRWLRSDGYKTDRQARPTEEEWNRLHERTSGIVLASFLPPDSTEEEQMKFSIKRGGAGRKSKAREMKWKIIPLLGHRKANGGWAMSLQALADRIGVGKGSINRVLDEIVPEQFVPLDFAGDRYNCRWRDLPYPNEVFRTMELLSGPKP